MYMQVAPFIPSSNLLFPVGFVVAGAFSVRFRTFELVKQGSFSVRICTFVLVQQGN